MNEDTLIDALLQTPGTLAVVGLSPDPRRPSHEVAAAMQAHGWRTLPVNPACTGRTILGEHCYPGLPEAARSLQQQGSRIDIVVCFRRAEHMPGIVEQAIEAGARSIWMQLRVCHAGAQAAAERAGLGVVADRCIKVEHAARHR